MMGEENSSSLVRICGVFVGLLIGCGLTTLIMKQSADLKRYEYALNYQKTRRVNIRDVDCDGVDDVVIMNNGGLKIVYYNIGERYSTLEQIRDAEIEVIEKSYYKRLGEAYGEPNSVGGGE